MPMGGAVLPIPYPNVAQAGAPGSSAMLKQSRGQQLRSQLHSLDMQISSLPAGNPNRWHQLLDNYAFCAAELYKNLTD
jgi:hypothetical protein